VRVSRCTLLIYKFKEVEDPRFSVKPEPGRFPPTPPFGCFATSN